MSNFSKETYNPFDEIKDKLTRGMKENEAITSVAHEMIACLLDGADSDPYMTAAAEMYASALLGYVYYKDTEEHRNINRLVEMLSYRHDFSANGSVIQNRACGKPFEGNSEFNKYMESNADEMPRRAYVLYKSLSSELQDRAKLILTTAVWHKAMTN